jgi:fatty-acyl-CoA synthase
VTGSNKILKRELQAESWHTDEAVYRWASRGTPEYRLMTAEDRTELDAEFAAFGRQRLL